jgi:signal peptidase II
MPEIRKGLWIWAGLIPALIVIFDQITKSWAIKKFNTSSDICATIPGQPNFEKIEFGPIFDLALVCNRGVSFGLFSNSPELSRIIFTVFAAIMSVVLIYWLSKEKDKLMSLSLALIIGGAIGNAIDRALYGAVTDFIDVGDLTRIDVGDLTKKGTIEFKWVFNVADSAITCGVIGLIICMLIQGRREKAEKAALENSQ